MISLMVGSTSEYSGKSVVCMGLGSRFEKDGLSIGYMKPIGTIITRVGEKITDEDAVFIERALNLDEPLDLLCPVVVTQDLKIQAYKGEVKNVEEKILHAYEKLSKGKDVLLIGGAGNLSEGAFLGVSGFYLAKRLNAKVILIDKYEKDICVDCLLSAKQSLGDRLIGVILNQVHVEKVDYIKRTIIPFLESKKIDVLGLLPCDNLLHSISIGELKENLAGEILCCEDKMDELVEHFSIGAMNIESALKYFRRVKNKAVVTGGDRSDIQLAALETSTKCIILTGHLYPNNIVLARAEERKIPIMVVRGDTLTTVEQMERVLRRLRVRDQEKVARAKELINKKVNFNLLYKKLGLQV